MELLYEVEPDLDGAEDYVVSTKRMKLTPERRPTIAISVHNLLAFSSNVDLSQCQSSSSSPMKDGGPPEVGKRSTYTASASSNISDDVGIAGCHLYVTDLNTPWEIFLIKNSSAQIRYLQWDHAGTKLCVGTDDGRVEIYVMVDNLLNKWGVSYEAALPGEPILIAEWLNAPRKVTVNPEKMDSMVYSEKYLTSVPFSSRGFGGKALDGLVVVTATGLLGAVVQSNSEETGGKPIVASEKMFAMRNHIVHADLAYSTDGDILVVTSTENMKQPVLVNKINVSLSHSRDKVEIKAVPCQSLFLQSMLDHSISSVKFINKCDTDHLLISLTNRLTGSSMLYIYELVAHTVTLKSKFNQSSAAISTGSDVVNTFRWQQTSHIQFGSSISSICSLPSPLIPNINSSISPTTTTTSSSSGSSSSMQNQNQQTATVLTPIIATALSNGCIVLSRCDNLQQICSYSTTSSTPSSGHPFAIGGVKLERDHNTDWNSSPTKKKECSSPSKINSGSSSPGTENPVSISFTWSGSILVSLTENSHLKTYKVHANLDASTAALLMELSMMGGLDPWDVMMCIRTNLIDNITDRLSETFARQPPPVQTHYNGRMLVIKAGLYRIGSSGTARINDQQTLLVLYLVSGALKALLRPAELSSREKGPAESLASLLSSSGEHDLTKVLVQMAATEYAVEANTLQSLQQILQWCADLALKLLSTLPDLRHSRAPGWEVCRDSKAVGTLRELIVLMRIWGLQRPSCLPAFRKTSENLDVLPLLFRLLTRLSVAPHDPDEALIGEAALLMYSLIYLFKT
ncbi:Mediator of RNA polymerase II transcription subunit 16 [Folsomia candida]|uniref:Mediator of RNA polymerase II transcription subunit 16 n=1 Tax=Folsomia candida TaxID=158441 RepID=A0A226D2X5_FOLCA|nr:Mediator of RNA polymerase II transcription subunit 16 [Folsomia candida]